ncbi:MAG: hypothetical protein OXC63_00665 [Aestuariivita sp.]|nr:hypothetical protein [Aestuariivita sp.]MCY4345873.1 hypothetical protein [Aestuariivita sp.]
MLLIYACEPFGFACGIPGMSLNAVGDMSQLGAFHHGGRNALRLQPISYLRKARR